MDGTPLVIENAAAESTTKVLTLDNGSKFELVWQLHAPEVGPMVQIRTGATT